jgi:outer membrane protein assembly factor BamB
MLTLGLVVWAALSRGMSEGPKRALLVIAMLLVCSVWTVVRTGGMTGDAQSDFHWRWTQTPEERLLAQPREAPAPSPPSAPPVVAPGEQAPGRTDSAPAAVTAAPAAVRPEAAVPAVMKTAADWPGFRGGDRDGVVRGVTIETDWSKSPPVELWRRAVGPGWSSFAVHGDLFYTQEQRGDDEIVACYRVSSGKPVWEHRDAARFWESNGGAGPRGTPTLSNGRVYTVGATGIVNALDARTGAVVWSHNAGSDTRVKVPGWGFSSSPLVIDDLVVVAASGALVAYDRATGAQRWLRPSSGGSYSSPHRVTLDGVVQIVLLGGAGAAGVSPADGTVLWENAWEGVPIVQPAMTADGDVLVTTGGAGGGEGIRRLAVARTGGTWTVEPRWTSQGLKPYFNDFVVHDGHAYGFDASILACIDLTDGRRVWKGGRYGHGQLVLLPDENLLLVLSEEGELALVKAAPDQFTELARFKAIEGKTWNHPVLVGNVLLVRNDQEMAAFRLSLAGR